MKRLIEAILSGFMKNATTAEGQRFRGLGGLRAGRGGRGLFRGRG
jgi:hypothetical protein